MAGWIVVVLLTASGFEENPGAAEAFERGNRAAESQKFDAAESQKFDAAAEAFARVTELAPDNPAGHLSLCLARTALDQDAAAVPACQRAFELEDSLDTRLALADAYLGRHGLGDLQAAKSLLQQTLQKQARGSDEWVRTKTYLCLAFRQDKATYHAETCASELLAAAPDAPYANLLALPTALRKGGWSDASNRLEKARPVMDPAQYAALRKQLDEQEPAWHHYGIPWLKALGVWAVLFALLALVGGALSWATLHTARRLATAREQHTSGVAKLIRTLYRQVVGAGALFYFVSLPLLAATVVAVGGGIIYGFFALGRIPVKLVVIVGVLLLTTLFALIKSLFIRVRDDDPGDKLDWREAPKLRALLDDVARTVGTRPVDNVYLTPGTDLAVMERGSIYKKLSGRSERCLILGVAVIGGMTQRAFRSVLAHEYGHFSNKDTAGGNVALGARISLLQMGQSLADNGAAWYNPAWLFFRVYWAVYLRISQGASRLQEVLADRIAIFSYGSAAFREGYTHVIRRSVRFDAFANSALNEVLEQKLPLSNLYQFRPSAPPNQDELEKRFQEELEREPTAYDSHPSSKDRLGWAETLAIPAPASGGGDEAQVWTLFEDRAAVEKRMTTQIKQNVAENAGVMIPDEGPGTAIDSQRNIG